MKSMKGKKIFLTAFSLILIGGGAAYGWFRYNTKKAEQT